MDCISSFFYFSNNFKTVLQNNNVKTMLQNTEQFSRPGMVLLNQHLLVQTSQWKLKANVWNIFNKVNNKDNRKTSLKSFWRLYWQLWTYFTHFSGVSVVDFEQVNVVTVWCIHSIVYKEVARIYTVTLNGLLRAM